LQFFPLQIATPVLGQDEGFGAGKPQWFNAAARTHVSPSRTLFSSRALFSRASLEGFRAFQQDDALSLHLNGIFWVLPSGALA
jgi:hypothetical protein